MVKVTFIVSDKDALQRVDKYLKKIMPTAPENLIYKLLRTKDVRVNNKKVQGDYILQESDVIFVFVTEAQAEEFFVPYTFKEVTPTFKLVYEDENIIAIHKPAGLLVHPTAQEKEMTLTNMVLTYLKRKGEFIETARGYIPSPVSRIDQDTDGIIVFAKKQNVHQILANAFMTPNQVRRVYKAVVHGRIDKVEGTINLSLAKQKGKVVVDNEGRNATTFYRVEEKTSTKSLIEVELLTGRQHQIRVHFQSIGHPLVGDQKYGPANESGALALNAYSLTFNNLPSPLDYLNGKTFIADNTLKLKKRLGEK